MIGIVLQTSITQASIIAKEPPWCAYAMSGCTIFSCAVGVWYFIYCLKVCRPHRKITLFAHSIHQPLDTDLAFLIFVRTLLVIGAALACYTSVVYAITEHWLLPSIPFGNRVAIAVGAVYVAFLGVKSSITAIHGHFQKQDKVENHPHIPPTDIPGKGGTTSGQKEG